MPSKIPVYRYTITMADGTTRTAEAIVYREEPPWIIWDDTYSTVLTLRGEKVDEIARSAEPVGAQRVDELTDREPTGT
jgi:hypothetical protein